MPELYYLLLRVSARVGNDRRFIFCRGGGAVVRGWRGGGGGGGGGGALSLEGRISGR